ncbi:MAG: hypothetical protein R3A46_09280 [Thermomicrobiales bacterium]
MGIEPLVQSTWDDLNQSLLYLAILHLTIVTFAGSILVARALVPSLIYTGHAPERARGLRPMFFALAAVAGVGAIILAFLWISSLDFAFDIYEHTYY